MRHDATLLLSEWRMFISDRGFTMTKVAKSVILRDENFTHLDDWTAEEGFKEPKVGDVFKHNKVNYEVLEVNDIKEQAVITVKAVDNAKEK